MTWCFPKVGLKESSDVRAAMCFNIVASLLDIHAVEIVGRAKIGKRVRCLFGEAKFATNASAYLGSDRLRGACKSIVIDRPGDIEEFSDPCKPIHKYFSREWWVES